MAKTRPRKAKPSELGGVQRVPGINGHKQTVEGYSARKKRTNATGGYLAGTRGTFQDRVSHRLLRCGNQLGFDWYPKPDKVLLTSAKFCGLTLLCPNCAHRRAAKAGAKLHEKLQAIGERFDFYLVTLTVKNGPDLAERTDHLAESFRLMREKARDYRRRKGPYVELARAEGLVWSFEVTHSEHGWHPHVHMIAALPKGSSPIYWGDHHAGPEVGLPTQLKRDWQAVTGDSCITNAKRIEGDDLFGGVCEAVKYAAKFSDLTIEQSVHVWRVLRGRRLMECSGVLRGVVIPEGASLLDQPLEGEYFRLLYLWHGAGYGLISNGCASDQVLIQSPTGTMEGTPNGEQLLEGPQCCDQGQHHAGAL